MRFAVSRAKVQGGGGVISTRCYHVKLELRDIDKAHLKLKRKNRVAPVWVTKSSYHRHLNKIEITVDKMEGGHHIEALNLVHDDTVDHGGSFGGHSLSTA